LCWIGVGLVTMVKRWFGAIAVVTVLRASAARSAIRLAWLAFVAKSLDAAVAGP